MTRLGVVLAGGRSTRFGTDKAEAIYAGLPLIDHAITALRPLVDSLVIAGRDWPGFLRIPDQPGPGLGPLGGLLAGLEHAAASGFTEILTCSCDSIGLLPAHVAALSPAPAILEAMPVIGLWPAALAAPLRAWLAQETRHSVYAFATHVEARRVLVDNPPANINRPEDLASLERAARA